MNTQAERDAAVADFLAEMVQKLTKMYQLLHKEGQTEGQRLNVTSKTIMGMQATVASALNKPNSVDYLVERHNLKKATGAKL